MVPGLALRVSWICVLLSCAAAFPATKGDYRYPYAAPWSNTGTSGSSNSPSGGSHLLLMPEAQQPSFRAPSVPAPEGPAQGTGYMSPLVFPEKKAPSFRAPSVPAPEGPAQGTGYMSPLTFPEKKAPSFPVQPQPASGTVGSWGAPYRFAPSHANAPTLRMGDGPMPYRAGSSAGYPAPRNEDGRVPYGGPKPDAPLMPAGEAYVSDPVFLPLPPRGFPELRWEAVPETMSGASSETPSETSPLPPSSYIIQTRNGFQRARDFHSHMQYSPEFMPPPMHSPTESRAPSKAPSQAPPSGSKGAVYYRG